MENLWKGIAIAFIWISVAASSILGNTGDTPFVVAGVVTFFVAIFA